MTWSNGMPSIVCGCSLLLFVVVFVVCCCLLLCLLLLFVWSFLGSVRAFFLAASPFPPPVALSSSLLGGEGFGSYPSGPPPEARSDPGMLAHSWLGFLGTPPKKMKRKTTTNLFSFGHHWAPLKPPKTTTDEVFGGSSIQPGAPFVT